MSTNPAEAPDASATTEAVRAHLTAPPSPHYERRWLAQADLGFSDATRQWVATAYLLA